MFSDQISTVLSNLSRDEETCKTVFKVNTITPVKEGIV